MGIAKQRGFTIIEVTLFIAISGLLAVLLMTGWTTRVNTERYRDSVVTLQSFLQQQYNLVYNVENERSSERISCDQNASVNTDSSVAEARGQSDCILLGRLVTVKTDGSGTNLTTVPIIGYEDPDLDMPSGASLQDVLNGKYKVQKLDDVDLGLSDAKLMVPWGATINDTEGKSFAKNFSMAIIRSPLDGTAHTYVASGENASFEKILGLESGNKRNTEVAVKMCLDPGTIFSGSAMAVIIRARASSQNAVVTEAKC